LSKASNVELAEAFLKEAKCDLEVAGILIKAVDSRPGDPVEQGLTEDELFCIGRRILFMLQQATEKLAKAFLIAYVAGTRLRPRDIGHATHRKVIKLLRDFLREKDRIISLLDELINMIEEGFNKLGKAYPAKKHEIDAFKDTLINNVFRPLLDDFSRILNELKVKESNKMHRPPCLKELEARGSPLSKLEEYLPEGVRRFNEAREKLKPYQDLLRFFLENPQVRREYKEKIELVQRILFSEEGEHVYRALVSLGYVPMFIITFSCMSWYIEGGRYPEVYEDGGRKMKLVSEMRDAVWSDIKNIERFKRELELLAKVVEEGVKYAHLLTENIMLLLRDALRQG
jgi:CHASE3 domain sensor protein